MRLNFILNGKRERALAEKQRQASIAHEKNIRDIVQSRESATKLKRVLEQNNIIIQIAGAIGHS